MKANLPRQALRVWSSLSTVREIPAISRDVMNVPQYARSTLTPRPSEKLTAQKQCVSFNQMHVERQEQVTVSKKAHTLEKKRKKRKKVTLLKKKSNTKMK